jgi:class 3 adenylate cyclase
VDLCGFTAFADRHGDERVVLVLVEMRTALREASARRGVRVVKWLGDGAMLSSTMTDAIVGLVVELDHRMTESSAALPIRAGMASGPVIMFEGDDYIGYPVNVAARLCALAQPHELLATSEVAGVTPSWIHAQGARSVAVKGLAHDVSTCNLSLADAGPDPVTDPVCGLTIAREHSTGDGDEHRFCSEACLGSWAERTQLART